MNRPLFPLLALVLAATAHAQKLSDVILSLDDRYRVVTQRQQVEAELKNELNSGQATLPTPTSIDWISPLGHQPSAAAIDSVSLAVKIGLLNQAVDEFEKIKFGYLNVAHSELGTAGAVIGNLRLFMEDDFAPLPRVDVRNFSLVLKELAWRVRRLRVLPWSAAARFEAMEVDMHNWQSLAEDEYGNVITTDHQSGVGGFEGFDPTSLGPGELVEVLSEDVYWTVSGVWSDSASASGTQETTVATGSDEAEYPLKDLSCFMDYSYAVEATVKSVSSAADQIPGQVYLLAKDAWSPLTAVERPGIYDMNEAGWQVLGGKSDGIMSLGGVSRALTVGGTWEETLNEGGFKREQFVETGYVHKAAYLATGSGHTNDWLHAHESKGGILGREIRAVYVPVFTLGLDATELAASLAQVESVGLNSGADGEVVLRPRPGVLFGIEMGPGLSGAGGAMLGVTPGINMEMDWHTYDVYHRPPESGGRFDFGYRLCLLGSAADYHVVHLTKRDGRAPVALPEFGRPYGNGSTAYDLTSMLEAWDAPRLKQVVGRELIANISYNGHYSYTVTVYRRKPATAPETFAPGVEIPVAGLPVAGAWAVENPDAGADYPTTPERLTLTSATAIHEVSRSALLSVGENITFKTSEVTGTEKAKMVIQNRWYSNPSGVSTVKEYLGGVLASTRVCAANWLWTDYRWADDYTLTAGSQTVTSTPTYALAQSGQYARFPATLDIACTGQGTAHLEWSNEGILTSTTLDNWSQTGNVTDDTLTETIEYNGACVATTWTEFTDGDERKIRTYSAPDGSITDKGAPAVDWTEIHYGDGTAGLPGLPHRITNKNGTGATYTWSTTAVTVKQGLMPDDTVTKGTVTTHSFNSKGYPTSTITRDIASDLQLAGTTYLDFTDWGAPQGSGDFSTGLISSWTYEGARSRLASITNGLGTTTEIKTRDALGRVTGYKWDGHAGTLTSTATNLSNVLDVGTGITTNQTWDTLGRPLSTTTTHAGVSASASATYTTGTVAYNTSNTLTGANTQITRDALTGAASATGSVLPFGGLTGSAMTVDNGLIHTKTEITNHSGTFRETWTDAWGRVRKTSVPSTTGTGADVTECFYSPPASTIRRVIIQEPSTRHIIRESDPYNPLGITSRIGIDSVSDSQLDDSDRQLESITTIDDGKLKTVLTGPGEPDRRTLLVTLTDPATGITTREINQGEESLTTTPNFTDKTVKTVSTKGWKQTGTINTLGLPTQTTFGANTGGPDAFLTTTVNAAWRADGTLSGATLQTGAAITAADFGPNGLLTGLSVPNEGNIFGGHSFSGGKETLTLGGVKTERAINGTAVSLTKAANTPDSAAPNLTPVTRTLTEDGTNFKTTIAPGTGSPTQIITNAAGAKTKHDYASEDDIGSTWLRGGYLASVACARGGDVTFGYSADGARDLKSIDYPAIGTPSVIREEFTHYPSGRTKTIDDQSGSRLLTYTRGHLWHSTWVNTGAPLSGYEVERVTDDNGRLHTVNLRRGGVLVHTHTIGYNGGSSEPSTIATGGFTASYGRIDPNTRAITSVTRGTLAQTWIRGTAGRIQGASAAGLSYTHSAWDARARRKNLITPNGSWSYDYDSNGQLERATKGTIELNYTFDAVGRRLGFGDNGNDPLNQFIALTNSTRSKNLVITANPGTEANPGKLYVNDLEMSGFAGGWLYPLTAPGDAAVWIPWTVRGTLQNGGDHAPNADAKAELSGYTYIPPKNESFTYDADGNRTGSALWTYRWDGRNKLIAATTRDFDPTQENNHTAAPEGWKVTFDYDAEGRRFQKTVIHKTTKGLKVVKAAEKITYLWDGWNLIYELHENEFGMRLWDREYLWGEDLAGGMDGGEGAGGAGGLLLIRDHRGESTTDYYPCYDTSGHVIALTDSAGAVAATYEYGPFGELLAAKGPMAAANPFRYATKYLDQETGLYYFGHRYYDPATAQWMNREPLGEDESLNLYSYCHNDPVNRVDVLGLKERVIGAAVKNGVPTMTYEEWAGTGLAYCWNAFAGGGTKTWEQAPDGAQLARIFYQEDGAWRIHSEGALRNSYMAESIAKIPPKMKTIGPALDAMEIGGSAIAAAPLLAYAGIAAGGSAMTEAGILTWGAGQAAWALPGVQTLVYTGGTALGAATAYQLATDEGSRDDFVGTWASDPYHCESAGILATAGVRGLSRAGTATARFWKGVTVWSPQRYLRPGFAPGMVTNPFAAKATVNTREFMFADNSRSAKEFTKLADDIVANGMQNKIIHYTEIDGFKYVLVGNDRLRIAERFLKNTDGLIFEKVELPFRGFRTAADVIWSANEMLDNILRGAAK